MTTIKTKDVSEALTWIIEHVLIGFSVDDSGTVLGANSEPILLKNAQGESVPLVIYQEKIPNNSIAFNPFQDGMGTPSVQDRWFYHNLRISLKARMMGLLEGLNRIAIAQKAAPPTKGKKAANNSLPIGLLDVVSTIIGNADDTLSKELKVILNHSNSIDIIYRSKTLTSHASFDLMDANDDNFSSSLLYTDTQDKVRKGSYGVIANLFKKIFLPPHAEGNPKELLENHYKSTINVNGPALPAKAFTWLDVLFKLYATINPLFLEVSEQPTAITPSGAICCEPSLLVDLGVFKMHLDRFPAYTQNARIMAVAVPETQAARPVLSATGSQVNTYTQEPPPVIRSVTGAIIGNPSPYPPQQGGYQGYNTGYAQPQASAFAQQPYPQYPSAFGGNTNQVFPNTNSAFASSQSTFQPPHASSPMYRPY